MGTHGQQKLLGGEVIGHGQADLADHVCAVLAHELGAKNLVGFAVGHQLDKAAAGLAIMVLALENKVHFPVFAGIPRLWPGAPSNQPMQFPDGNRCSWAQYSGPSPPACPTLG